MIYLDESLNRDAERLLLNSLLASLVNARQWIPDSHVDIVRIAGVVVEFFGVVEDFCSVYFFGVGHIY